MPIEYRAMKICRFNHDRLGLVTDDGVYDVTNALGKLPAVHYPFPRHDALIAHLAALRPEMERLTKNHRPTPVDKVKLLSPVANPGKIIAAPVNYKKHLEEALADKGIHHGNLIQEIHKAGMFLKATSALVGAGQGVTLVHTDRRNDHEVELAVVIGKKAKNVKADNLEKGGRSILLPGRAGGLTVHWKLHRYAASFGHEVQDLRAAYRRHGG